MKWINWTIIFFATVIFTACGELPDRGGAEVIETEGGFEMVWHKQGEGAAPNPGDYVYFHRVVTIGDSVVHDSRRSGDMPVIEMPPQDDEEAQSQPELNALHLMGEGDSATVMMPSNEMLMEGFGLAEDETLDFNIKVHDIVSPAAFQERMLEQQKEQEQQRLKLAEREGEVAELAAEILSDYKAGNLQDQIVETESGLRYIVHEEGSGDQFTRGDVADVHYYGLLVEDGSMFDNSFGRGATFNLNVGVGMVIQGWDEALMKLRKGAVATLFIPHQLAYGEAGQPPVIPERAELMFYIEVQE
ncbi:MAG: hypothetical protein EA411_11695 [Saprospirales bacterium]|nr:MAG: hypothetical protein EA411_11695 [Saprospirales bacterium]